jgi:hypothetical protein
MEGMGYELGIIYLIAAGLSITVLVSYFFLCVNVDKIARKVGAKGNNSIYWEAVLWAKIGNKRKAADLFNAYISGKIIKQANKEQQVGKEQDEFVKTSLRLFSDFYRDYNIPKEYWDIPETTPVSGK